MSTAVESAPAKQALPLSDSLMAMIDAAHAEPANPATKPGTETQPQPTPAPSSTPVENKAAEGTEKKPVPSEKAEPTAEAKPEETKKPGAEDKGKPDQVELIKKRLNDQNAANSRLGRELKAAQEKIHVLEQQIAGTYQPPAEPSPEETARVNEFRGKEVASRRMASEKYGETFVNGQIYDDGAPYQRLIEAEPWHHIRVARSDNPVEEALRVLSERKVYEELGPDPENWKSSLREQIRAELMKEMQKQQAESAIPTGKPVPSVGDGRGAAEGREAVKVDDEFSLSSLGGHFID